MRKSLEDSLRETLRKIFINKNSFGSKLYADTTQMIFVIKSLDRMIYNFIKIGISILVIAFVIRGIVNGTLIPYSITYVVDGLKNSEKRSLFLWGLTLFGVSGLLFAVTELMLMIYFKKLTRGIVVMKHNIIEKILRKRDDREDPEDLVGKIANDVDFIVWNVNGVLTTLMPNLFTTITALTTVYSFSHSIGIFISLTMLPYILYAEYYSRKVEVYRTLERKTYSQSIVYIKNLVFGERVNGDLYKTLREWNNSIDQVLWLDRIYWSLSLGTALISMTGISLLAEREISENSLGIATLSGLLYASLTAHFGMLNAMWALCIQGQTIAALKRVMNHLITVENINNKRL
jgi:ABC-type multidrug transport system fused ATPase/permease subunit